MTRKRSSVLATAISFGLSIVLLAGVFCFGSPPKEGEKTKILVVNSYHRENGWSKEANKGFRAAMIRYGYFDSGEQAAVYAENDFVETSRIVVRNLWLDAQRKNNRNEIAAKIQQITGFAREFDPDLIFLGDEDAVERVGPHFLDTRPPVVFWGVHNTPVKYGLVDRIERPGHNVTGVYRKGFKIESLHLLKRIVPGVRTFAVLSDDTSAGRNDVKAIEHLARKGVLPLAFSGKVVTNDFALWKRNVRKMEREVDSFFIAQYAGLKDESGEYVPPGKVAEWYLSAVGIPETVEEADLVRHGMLCAADEPGYRQGFEAVRIAHDILAKGAAPSTYPPRSPKRGALIVNQQRAAMLGIALKENMGIEEYLETASASPKIPDESNP